MVKVLLAPTWELAKDIEAEVTVEAEYGDKVKEGKEKTLAHHSGKYKGELPVSVRKESPLGYGTVLISHIDADTVIACLDLLGYGSYISDRLRKIVGIIDEKGPHYLDEIEGITEEDKEKYYALSAYLKGIKYPRDRVSDVTSKIKRLGEVIKGISKHKDEYIDKGRRMVEKERELEERSYLGSIGEVLIRKSDQFVNHLYKHGGKRYRGVVAYNTEEGGYWCRWSVGYLGYRVGR